MLNQFCKLKLIRCRKFILVRGCNFICFPQNNGMSSSPPAKVAKMSAKKIGTHNGHFHCDEVLACFMLKQLPEYSDAEIVRTRDASKLETCDIVVDVGGVYDPEKLRFDHHMRTFNESMNSVAGSRWTTKLSSAGLVYLHLGRRVLASVLGAQEDDKLVAVLYDKVYENFVEEIDAIDNGISVADGDLRYRMTSNLSSRVGHHNPRWNDPNPDEEGGFRAAMEMVGAEFVDRIKYYAESWWPAKQLVRDALEGRMEADGGGEIMVLKEGGCPWKEHLYALETELGVEKTIKFVLYTDQSGKWRVQTVPVTQGSFQTRVPLAEAWRGLRDAELSEKSGIPGCVFVHASGFIGGNATYDGALTMARETLKMVAAS